MYRLDQLLEFVLNLSYHTCYVAYIRCLHSANTVTVLGRPQPPGREKHSRALRRSNQSSRQQEENTAVS